MPRWAAGSPGTPADRRNIPLTALPAALPRLESPSGATVSNNYNFSEIVFIPVLVLFLEYFPTDFRAFALVLNRLRLKPARSI
jgi:hypothetical protein